MTDALGWRAKFGVLGPSTNTIVQPDFDDMRPVGVTNHYSRIFTPNAAAVSNESFMAGTSVIAGNVMDAVDSAMTCLPSYFVMGMSAVTFIGGAAGADAFEKSIVDRTGLGVSMGSAATAAALRAYGANRVAFLSPYFPAANAHVRQYLHDVGFTVVRDMCLQSPSWTGIAEVQPKDLIGCLKDLDGDDVDAIVQVGTNLSMARLAAAAELFLGKPVIAINTATYWHALRSNGIADKKAGFGQLLERF
ncbi:arylmalonate decarboxylase [Acidisphaera sp. L21]|jgi:maleate isomerase|uniref:maleate cis-trans isomerase family protein n=1 Tax=Acidisphaera sp. L21 TaxID=1641851 RepID=UPI00131E89DB|nr:arylmalonate decarboxylase [Acidisphaera sp. L21]